MAKTYKIDKTKEAMSSKPWGEVDKEDLRNKIMEADNKEELVKACYMLIEDGWEEAPSQHLKYPVMNFEGDTLVYNRDGLASALGYAKKEKETTVVNKVEKIYKDLDLDDSDGKEEKEMSEIEFAAVCIDDLWSAVYRGMHDAHEWDYYIRGIYEEDNQKFAIVYDDAKKLYRLDFSLTEEGLTLADEILEVREEFVETENMKKFAEPEDVEKYQSFAEENIEKEETQEPSTEEEMSVEETQEPSTEEEMSVEEMKEKITQLESLVEEKENIIMDKDKIIADRDIEIDALRNFKQDVETKEQAMAVEKIMSEMTKFMDRETAENFRQEGLNVEFTQIDAWANKVKASVVDKVVKADSGKKNDVFAFSAPIDKEKKSNSVWDRLP